MTAPDAGPSLGSWSPPSSPTPTPCRTAIPPPGAPCSTSSYRLTFGIRGRRHAARHQAQGLFAFALGLALTAGCLATLHALYPGAGRGVELSVLVAANLGATLMRFLILRGWMYHRRAGATAA